jgi:putative motility protein YjfB-like
MDISDISGSAAAQTSDAVALAVQKLTLDAIKSQGAQLNGMLAPRGSVNSPTQGANIDAWA